MSHSHVLHRVANLIGHQPTIRLVRSRGGRELLLPQPATLHDTHWLVVLVGLDNAHRLCRAYAATPLKLPIEVNALLQLRDWSIVDQYRNGANVSQLAREHEIDRKLVQKILDRAGIDRHAEVEQ